MTDCPIYLNLADVETTPSPAPPDDKVCNGCNCGYLQYESLIPYLKELRDSLNLGSDLSLDFEFKLREQIAEISRLFDMEAGVTPGYFSKAHYKTTKKVIAKGNRYIKLEKFVTGTLEVRSTDDVLIDPVNYEVINDHLVWRPCDAHVTCGCDTICGNDRITYQAPWPETCYKVRAKWGLECADLAVQKAVRDYLIETYRMQDPVVQLANGITIQRTFRVPHAWTTYIKNFKDKRKIFSNFAIA
jgi:hypothetical protein